MRFDWKYLMGETPSKTVSRGSFLKFPDRSWNDAVVVLMVCEWVGDSNCYHSLVRLCGSKGGINPLQLIPNSAFGPGEALDVGWLVRNWNNWVWLESDPASVEICYGPVSCECFE